MNPTAERVVAEFCAAYGPYVRTRLGGTAPIIEVAIASGEVWLREQLMALLVQPFAQQQRGPLEVLQEAIRFPTEALTEAGVEPPLRDEPSVAALPGDLYALAPISSRDLGEAAWMAHLEWGATKAAALDDG